MKIIKKTLKNIKNIKHTKKIKILKNKKIWVGGGGLGKTPRYLIPLKIVQCTTTLALSFYYYRFFSFRNKCLKTVPTH